MIGILNAYHYHQRAERFELDYGKMALDFFAKALPNQVLKTYDAGLGQLPGSVSECEGWIITGSAKSAADLDPWIQALGAFIQDVDRAQRPLIGICFGHQLVAQYLGGRAEKAKAGWGVGVRSFEIIKQEEWMQPKLTECSLIFSHQDQVVLLPRGAELLARDNFCPHQMYSIGRHILCMQGHPEFTPNFAKGRLDARVELIGKSVYDKAVESLTQQTNADQVGAWIRHFLAAK